MVKVLKILIILMLTSCTTHREIVMNDPRFTFTNSGTTIETAICIESEWIEDYGTTKTRKTHTGHQVYILNDYGGVLVLADINPEGAGSLIKVYETDGSMIRDKTIKKAEQFCSK